MFGFGRNSRKYRLYAYCNNWKRGQNCCEWDSMVVLGLLMVFHSTFFHIGLFNRLLQGNMRFGSSDYSHFKGSTAISLLVTQRKIRMQFGRICDRNLFLGLTMVFYSTFFCIGLIIMLRQTIRCLDTSYFDYFWRRTPDFCLRDHDGVLVSVTISAASGASLGHFGSSALLSLVFDRNL